MLSSRNGHSTNTHTVEYLISRVLDLLGLWLCYQVRCSGRCVWLICLTSNCLDNEADEQHNTTNEHHCIYEVNAWLKLDASGDLSVQLAVVKLKTLLSFHLRHHLYCRRAWCQATSINRQQLLKAVNERFDFALGLIRVNHITISCYLCWISSGTECASHLSTAEKNCLLQRADPEFHYVTRHS